ncbi:MAG: efflux RND transporter permease subunit [Flavobacteriaceae bacterium]
MRKVISYFIKYPVAVNVIIIGLFLLGILGFVNMRSSFFPLTDSRIININVAYPGSSPQEMEEGVVLKIEENLKGLVGVERVTSVSRENSGAITVEVLKGYDVNIVLADVKNAVDRVPNYPTGMEPPVVSKVESILETVSFVVTGPQVSLKALKKIARDIESDLRRMDGISQINVTGFPEEEIEIAVRENDLRAYNVNFTQIAQAVSQSNILTTGGSIKTDAEEYLIRARNRSYYGDELDDLVVKAEPNGRVVRLKDVANVRDRWNESPNKAYYNGELSVRVQVNNTNSEDLLSSAEQIKAYIKEFNEANDRVQIAITRDSSITLEQRTQLLFKNAWQGMLLVLLFLSLFLRPRLAFWVAAGLPVAFMGMFMLADLFDVTINVLSLFGMIIVIGILVDDGIVISENIYHHYEKGKNPIRAAIDGTMEVVPPIISAITTTVLAFSIFFFLDARIGEFFSEVATVVTITLAISLIEALIILPAHVAHSKALDRKQKVYAINRYAEAAMDYMRDRLYAPVLSLFVKNRFFALMVPLAFLILTIGAIGGGLIRITFFPSIASDRVSINLTMPQGTNEKITDSIITSIETIAWEVGEEYNLKQEGDDPVIDNIIRRIGPGTSTASLSINLLPGELRSFSAREINNAIRDRVGPVYGVESLTFGSGGNFGGSPVSVSLVGNNVKELKLAKEALKSELAKNPELKDITDTDPQGIKEIKINLKENAYLLGFNLSNIMSQVRSGFFGLQVQRFQRGQDEIKVWVRYEREERTSLKNLDDMRLVSPNGTRVAFSEIANYEIERGEIAINHIEGQREIRIDADIKDDKKTSATDVNAEIKNVIMPEITKLYPTVSALFEGQNRETEKMTKSIGVPGTVILLLIFIVIVFTFRSFSQPILLILMVPLSIIGVAWGHYFHNFPINMLSLLGIIALVGIMVNDGLVLISKFNLYLKDGMKFDEALIAAGKSRFRAIFLTTITTVAGLAPLIFETSRQAQFLIPMAISIAYGIMIATLLTLLTLPVLLSLVNEGKVLIKWFWTGVKPSKESVESAIKEMKYEQESIEE